MKEIISEIKKKKEFSQLPDSVVERVAGICKNDVKESRALLRKYFGVFLTNKVLKIKDEGALKSHISSRDRDYDFFYKEILGDIKFNNIIDIGCGVNGFSYGYLKDVLGDIGYLGIEATGQLVDNMNLYFKQKKFKAEAVCEDIFDFENVKKYFQNYDSPRCIFLFQIIDAIESFERNSSKRFLIEMDMILNKNDLIVITMPMKSISGRKSFEVKRYWLENFLLENFVLERDFEVGSERIFLVRKR
jgi:hypothetical protein